MKAELLEAMTDIQFSAKDAAKMFDISDGRLQTWMNRGFMQFKSIEQGPRRLLRRFDGHDLLMLGTMVSLVDDHGIDVSDAHHISSSMHSSISVLLMEFKSSHGVKGIGENYYAITDGEALPCFGIDSLHEVRKRVGKGAFMVFDATPAIYKALLVVLQSIEKEVKAELAAESAELEGTA